MIDVLKLVVVHQAFNNGERHFFRKIQLELKNSYKSSSTFEI